MDLSVSNKVLFLRLISDICPNSPSLDVCSKIPISDYAIMKPHDLIVNNVMDNKGVGLAIISGEGGSGKTYGIGYYLYYKHFSRGFNKNTAVIYSTLSRGNTNANRVGVKVKLSSISLIHDTFYDAKGLFEYLTSLKGEYSIPLNVHVVIDNVNEENDINEIVSAYKEKVRFFKKYPTLKVYILTRIRRGRLTRLLKDVGFNGPYSIWADSRYLKTYSSMCKIFQGDKYTCFVCKMSYDGFSYLNFMMDLLDKLTHNSGENYSNFYSLMSRPNSGILTSLEILSRISPALVIERVRDLILSFSSSGYIEILDMFRHLINDYPYTLISNYAYIPPNVKRDIRYLLSKRLVKLFLRKYPINGGSKGQAVVAVDQNPRVPLDFVMIKDTVYSLVYIQNRKELLYAVNKVRQFIRDLENEEMFRESVTFKLITMFPRRTKWLKAAVEDTAKQSKGLEIELLPLARKDLLFLTKGLVHYS
ncbi:hypothetical protein [Stygiolobus caldivivus]|uniref:Uncharacterized protein n=1 Tax=Stygiolobus caldivivus TaxID=2824673 RepID=A0A8D5U5R3_9CREN|nr:hypothetical protein [Stygiolobus caldivivus]BCU70060.1 hypothetical protein KN1_13570 [Stygiolobus caldivivus]